MKPHFRLFGVPVRIDPSFVFLVVLLGYFMFRGNGDSAMVLFAAWIPIATGAILLHELGHALVARAFGLSPFVMLHGMGGVTQCDARAHRALSHGRRVLITLAGPFAGIAGGVLAAVFAFFFPPTDGTVGQHVLEAILFTTIGWGVLNLIPMLPLDGGHVVATILDRFFGIRGVLFARIASAALAGGLAVLAFHAQQYFMLFVLGWLAYNNWRSYQLEKAWQSEAPLEPYIKRAFRALEEGELAEVRRLAEVIGGAANTSATQALASHLLAWAHLLEGDAPAAARVLEAAPKGHPPDALLEGRVLLECGRPSEAIGPLVEALADRRDEATAEALSAAIGQAGRADELIALLESSERSEKTGASAVQHVAHKLFLAGEFELAAGVYERAFERFSHPEDAFNAACAWARTGERSRALRFLSRAVESGLRDASVFDDEDLASLRGDAEFERLREVVR